MQGAESSKSLQETFAPENHCFGCGPANRQGLGVRSHVAGEEVTAEWMPQPVHEAFDGVLNGGIIGTLLDCHCNWAAAHYLMQRRGVATPPCTVTAEYTIKLRRPTPSAGTVRLRARLVEASDDRATIAGTLESEGQICATCTGVFVAVQPGHPAYHRW